MMPDSTTNKTAFGFWLYIMSDCVLFAGLFAVYAVLRTQSYGGPTIGNIVNLPFVLGETMFLLTSSFTVGLAIIASWRGSVRATIAWLMVTLALGLSFLGMELYEFAQMVSAGHSWKQSAFLSSYFALVGTHGLHVTLGSLWLIVMIIAIGMRGLSISNSRKLLCLSLFWHFLDIIWIFIYTFVYLFGSI